MMKSETITAGTGATVIIRYDALSDLPQETIAQSEAALLRQIQRIRVDALKREKHAAETENGL